LPSEVELYKGHHYARFDVKPGITGPWQVGGRNSIRNFESVVRLETAYIRSWSIQHDLELLFRTIPAVLSRRGAL
jgi:lipopolysaccharide/colanic/teichoic acid biosynthesis glycosyltransferase